MFDLFKIVCLNSLIFKGVSNGGDVINTRLKRQEWQFKFTCSIYSKEFVTRVQTVTEFLAGGDVMYTRVRFC